MGWSTTFQDNSMYMPIPGYESTDLSEDSDSSQDWMQNNKELIAAKVSWQLIA